MPRLEKRVPPPFAPDEVKAPLDGGLGPSEFVGLTAGNANMRTRLVTVPGKVEEQRTVRLGAKTGKSILRYLATQQEVGPESPLWIA